MDLANFHLLRPLWLLGLIPLALLVWRMARIGHGARAWSRVCDAKLLPHLLVGEAEVNSRAPLFMSAFVGTLCLIAVAGPVWEKVPQPVFRAQLARVFVLDLSASMDTNDVRPSRIVRAKQKLTDMLAASGEGQTGLVVFAGSPHVVSPLTDDAATITSMVPALSTELMPLAGSRPELALEMAEQLLVRSGIHGGQIILIGDDGSGEEVARAAAQLKKNGHHLSVMAVGTEIGAPLPLREGGFLKDQNGTIVVPRLDIAPLRALATAGGGDLVELRPDDSDVTRLMAPGILAPAVNMDSESSRKTDLWREEGPWLLLAVLPLAAFGFRRGWLGVFLLPVLSLSAPPPAQAFELDWPSLWFNQDQRASRLLQDGKAAEAAPLFSDPNWAGTAYYRAGKFDAATKAFGATANDATAHYNLGNALAKQGQFDQAIAAYDRALGVDPGHADAKFNRDLLRKHQQEQAKKQSQSSPNEKNEGQNGEQQADSQEGKSGSNEQTPKDEKSAKPGKNGDAGAEDSAQNKDGKSSPAKQQPGQENESLQAAEHKGERGEKGQQAAQAAPDPRAPKDGSSALADAEAAQKAEVNQATEQWLRRIPDDPGGLLRRKFLMQLQQGKQEPQAGDKTW